MGLIDHDYDLTVQTVSGIVFPVFDDLIVNIFQYQQHLRVGNGGIAVRQHGLEVKDRKILVRGHRRRTVPDIGISSAGGELGHVIDQRTQHGTQILIFRPFKFRQDLIIEIVKDRIILRFKSGKIGFCINTPIGIHSLNQGV